MTEWWTKPLRRTRLYAEVVAVPEAPSGYSGVDYRAEARLRVGAREADVHHVDRFSTLERARLVLESRGYRPVYE